MTISVFPFLRLVSVCGAALMGSSCRPMFGAGQVLVGSSLADGLLPSSSLDLVWINRRRSCLVISFTFFSGEIPLRSIITGLWISNGWVVTHWPFS